MNDLKVYNAFHNVEKLSNRIILEVDIFMKDISDWANHFKETIKEKKICSTFLPPKPPEQRTYRKKGRKVLTSNVSSVNTSSLQNESCNLDETISSRTRGGRRRAATSKMSELTVVTKNENHEETKEVIKESLIVSSSEPIIVTPRASSTRTKQMEVLVQESEGNEVPNEQTADEGNTSPQKKVSRTEAEMPSKQKISRTPREISEESPSPESAEVIEETPIKTVIRGKLSRALSESPAKRSTPRLSKTLSGSVASVLGGSAGSRNPSKSPRELSSGSKKPRIVSGGRQTRSGGSNKSLERKASTPEQRASLDRTITIKKELMSTTFVVADETSDNERTPLASWSTPGIDLDKTPVVVLQRASFEENPKSTEAKTVETTTNAPSPISLTDTETKETVSGSDVPKKKRRVKENEEDVKENIQQPQETMRITRTKSKAIRQMMEEQQTRQPVGSSDFGDLSNLAKKVLNKAKIMSANKSRQVALLESNSPGHTGHVLTFKNLTASKTNYHLLASSTKTPSNLLKSGRKDPTKQKVPNEPAADALTRTVTKAPKDDLEKDLKLKSKKEKEEEAAVKRQNVIKFKQEELKRKNELKHQMVLKQREKLEQQKYINMVQSEKEKEERHKLILQERQAKVKEEVQKRKMLKQQKIAETVERRRIEEEARIARLKEMEAEEQRLALERQREQERQEKRAQERLAEKRAREEYEMQIRQEQEAERLKVEKLLTAKKCLPSASKMESANKRQKFGIIRENREWDFRPRNEHDYGLEDENSEVDSEDERSRKDSKPAVPWAKKIMHRQSPCLKRVPLEMLCEFIKCHQKSPDIYKMFKMTPSKRIKRSSSAIWNTPSS